MERKLDTINRTLEKQNGILQQMLDILPRPAGRFTRALEMVVLVVGAFGILHIFELVRKWVIGG